AWRSRACARACPERAFRRKRGEPARAASAGRLPDRPQELDEPRGARVKGLAALDAPKLDRPQDAPPVLVVADDAALPAQGALHREVAAALDEAQVLRVRGGRPRKVPALLHEHLLGADHLSELVAEPLSGVDGVELHVPERVARGLLPPGLHLGHDALYARALGHKE